MADYYPSEIARLVLGYLTEANCPKACETFLVESIDLQEHYRLLQSGRSCSTNIEGKSLLEILHEYRCLKESAEKNEANSSYASLNTSHLGPSSSNFNPNGSQSGPSSSNRNLNTSHSGPSSSNANPNASSSETFKTPQKNIKIQQSTQSQATVRFAQGGNRSPQCVSTPTRPLSSRTPSRLQGVCVTTLNFGAGGERNEGPTSVYRGIIAPKRLYTRTPAKETITAQRLCYSEPLKRKPAMLSRMVQTDNLSTSQVDDDDRNCQTSSDLTSHQRDSESTSTENSHRFTSSASSTNYNGDELPSNNEYRNPSDRTNLEENMNNSRSLLPANTTTSNTAIMNQTIVFTSTEIRTGGENDNSSTPQYDIEPPSYARAPGTNSPRLILSLDRSQVTSLTTPLKDRRQWHEEFASPRRKGTIPRRRLLSESPYPKQNGSNDGAIVAIHENVESIIEELMSNQPFTQRLADNINKVISEDPEASNSTSFPTLQDIQNSDAVIQNIIARAEHDSLFNDILSLFGNSRDCDDLNVQDSAVETEEVFSTTEGTQTNKDDSEKVLVMETMSSKDETDSSMKHDSTQEKNNESISINETSSQMPAASEVPPVSNESAANQSSSGATNIEDPEPMQVDNDKSNLTGESGTKDVLSSCMSIIQPDTDSQMQNFNLEQNSDILNNVNDVQSTASNVNESSTLVSPAVAENITGFDDASTLKPVSIGTPFQVGSQIAVSQATCGINQSIPSNQTIVCYPPQPLMSNTMSFIPSNRNVPILPAVQNQSFILNSNFQTSPFLQFSYAPNPGFPVQQLDPFQSKLILVQQPCNKHSTNWANNTITNDVIIPVQTVSAENVAQPPIVNPSPIKIPEDYSPSKSFLADNVGKFVTVTSETAQTKKKPDKRQSTMFTVQPSPVKDSRDKRRHKKKRPKKKLRPLFPPPKDPVCSTENEVDDNIPVLSIPDISPSKDDSMSAMEILNSITDGKSIQSPMLKAVISSAKILAEKGGRLNSTHVRTLEFSSPQSEDGNKSKQSKNSSEGDGRRSSPRLKQKTACKSPCCSPLKSSESAIANKKGSSKHITKEKEDVTADLVSNAIEKLSARKAVSSSMSNVVLNAMQDALQAKPTKSKKQDSATALELFQRAEISLTPAKKTPPKCPSSDKKTDVQQRNQYFPDSSSDSDSSSDNIPLSAIVASKLKGSLKVGPAKSSPPKQNTLKKSIVEKETAKNGVEDIPPSSNIENVTNPIKNKDSEVPVAVLLNANSSSLPKVKSYSIEDSDAFPNISKISSLNEEKKSFRKCSGSNRKKSIELHRGKESGETNSVKPTESHNFSEVPGNSPSDPIVLESDEDLEIIENIASQVMCSPESKLSKKEQKKKHKKKKHISNLNSPSKRKTLNRKRSKEKNSRKNSHVSRKSKSPRRIRKTKEHLLKNEKPDSLTEKDICKPYSHVSQKSVSPRISKTKEHLLQDEKPDSLAEKDKCEAPKESYSQKEKQILCDEKSTPENSDLFQKPKKKMNINETNSHPLSNEETAVSPPESNCKTSQDSTMKGRQKSAEKGNWYLSSPQKIMEVSNPDSETNCKTSQNSTMERKQNSGEKGSWYISSPQKVMVVSNPESVEKSQNSLGTIKKNKNINELCDKLRLNAVQKSPRKKKTTEADKLPNTTVENPVEISASLKHEPSSLETTVIVNPTENETLKLTSILTVGEEKSIINTRVRNNITLDSDIDINSKQSSVENETIIPFVKKRVLPPPKKRIRPVPVPSPCGDGSFSPFGSSPAHSISFDSTAKPKELPSVSKNLSDSETNKTVSCLPELHSSSLTASTGPASESKDKPPLAKNTSNTEASTAPELNFPENAVSFDSPLKPKEVPSLSPINVGVVRKCSAGKPKAMAEFYKSALPDRDNDFPISPVSMSSSSCTVDTFLARRNLQPLDTNETSPNKDNSLVNKISPEKKEPEKVAQKRKLSTSVQDSSDEEGVIEPKKVGQKRKLSTSVQDSSDEEGVIEPVKVGQKRKLPSSVQDSSDEEGVIKSPPRIVNVTENNLATEAAPGDVALPPSSTDHPKDVHLSSSDEEGLIKSPVKNLSCEQKSDQTSSHPEKKRKLSTAFSSHHEAFSSSLSDHLKIYDTDKSLSLHDKTVVKHNPEQKSPVRHSSLIDKPKLKSSLKSSSNPSSIPAGVKIPSKWNNSKINNYSHIITGYEDEMIFKNSRKSRPSIKVVGIISPPKKNTTLKRKNYHLPRSPFPPYKTLYSERQARKLQLEHRRSPFRQSPNVNNCRSSAHRHRNESKHTPIPETYCKGIESSFSKETMSRDYSRKKHEHKDIPGKNSKTDCQEDRSRKHISPYESSNNKNSSKHESSSCKVSGKHLDNDSSYKHGNKKRIISPEKSNLVDENRDKLSFKNVEEPGKQKRNIQNAKKSNESFHKQTSSNLSSDERRKSVAHKNKQMCSKESLSSSNKQKSSNNLMDKNVSSSVPVKSNSLFEKDRMNLTAVPKSPSSLSYDKDSKLETLSKERHVELSKESQLESLSKERHVELSKESQLEKPSLNPETEPNKQIEQSDLNCSPIADDAIEGTSRTSTDQTELDQAVAFLTNDENPESQEPEISSQNTGDINKVTDDSSDKSNEDFGALVIKQLSKAAGLSVLMQTAEISHLLDKIKEFGLENIAQHFSHNK